MNQTTLKEKIQAMPVVRTASRHFILSPVRTYFRYFPVSGGKRFLWKSVACHVRWLESWTTATTLFGSKLRVDPKDDVGRCIYYFGVWEPNLTAWIYAFSFCGRHVCRCRGQCRILLRSSCWNRKRSRKRSIHREHATDVRRSQSKLPAKRNPQRENCAHGGWDAVGEVEMFGPATGVFATASAIKSRAEQWDHKSKVIVPCAPLSEILTATEIKAARIVKIDVEGSEWRVICGMNDLMKSGETRS